MKSTVLPSPPPARTSSLLLVAGTILSVLFLLFARRPEAFLHPQFWAEDGAIFFNYADRYGWHALTMPYAGYHHVLLRLVSCTVAGVDSLWIPLCYLVASTAALLAVTLALFSPRLDLAGWQRPALALAIVLVPHTGEVFTNLTNVQWITALGLVLLLWADDPVTWRQHAFDAIMAVVVGLTGVFSAMFAPLFIARAAWRRSRASWLLAGLVSLAAIVQVRTYFQGPVDHASVTQSPMDRTRIAERRIVETLLFNSRLSRPWPRPFTVAVSVAVFITLCVLAFSPAPQRRLKILLLACLFALWLATSERLKSMPAGFAETSIGDRYFFLPRVLVLWLLILEWNAATRVRWIPRVASLLALVGSAQHFRFEPLHDYDWPAWAAKLRAHQPVVVPVNPGGFTFTHPGRWPR